MTNAINRRIEKMETTLRPRLPHHLPIERWTDDQLMRAINPHGGTMSDTELLAIADGANVDTVLAARITPFQSPKDGRAFQ